MLEVAEFQQSSLPLPGRKAGVKVPHGGKEGAEAGFGGFPVKLGFVEAATDKVFDLLKELRASSGPGS